DSVMEAFLSGEPLITPTQEGRTLCVRFQSMSDGNWVGTSLDKTEELKHQAELRVARRNAEAASKAKSQFLANMSHEIRTPLNAVLGFASLLRDSALDERQRDFVDTIADSGESLLAILNDILDVSKIEAGALELEEASFNLERLVRSVMTLLSVRAQSKDLEIVSYVDPSIPVALVGDPGRLRQILLNLIGNAIKFTEEGGIALEIKLEELLPGDRIVISCTVSDTGLGISAEQQASLFERFTQGDLSTTRQFGGTGLGLSICHDLIKLMDGSISVTSELGKGSSFKARIILTTDDGDERYLDDGDAQSIRGRRILVVDDNQVNLRVIGLMLAAYGCKVETVDDPTKAHDVLSKAIEKGKPFDVAVIDHMMPSLDGVGVATLLREDNKLDSLRLILSSSGIATATQAAEWGFDATAPKPVSQRRLVQTMQKLLSDAAPLVTRKSATPSQEDTAGTRAPLPARGRGEVVSDHAGGTKKPQDGSAQCRVLLADDNPVNLKLIQSALEKHPFTVDTVANGREAVASARSLPYDLILMDVQMVEMDGIEATKRIRKLGGPLADIPIIAVTAGAMTGDREKCIEAGMNDYVAKPVVISELLEKIRFWTSETTAML
ncbi:MAG: response regulator, partial [Parvibaculum sp.]